MSWSLLTAALAVVAGVIELKRSVVAGATIMFVAFVYFPVLFLHIPLMD